MVLKGVGSALSNNAVYPDLVLGFAADDALLQATISALWNAAYAVGWAAGLRCSAARSTTPRWSTSSAMARSSRPARPAVAAAARAAAAAAAAVAARRARGGAAVPVRRWMPNNGFDGFASGTAVVSLAFAVVLLVAAAFNVGAKKPAADRPSGSTMVEPLVAADI